jgi:dTDP-4-dehydrorhamnose 3,5-epimerase
MGAMFDVIIDLRPDSPTFKQWLSFELNAENRSMLYIPPGLAHGFLTLEDNTEVLYQISDRYVPESAAGVRWNDTAFGIQWPEIPRIISEKDQNYTDFIL